MYPDKHERYILAEECSKVAKFVTVIMKPAENGVSTDFIFLEYLYYIHSATYHSFIPKNIERTLNSKCHKLNIYLKFMSMKTNTH